MKKVKKAKKLKHNHTPGPWFLGCNKEGIFLSKCDGKKHKILAYLTTNPSLKEKEHDADLHMIKAAPLMYELLCDILISHQDLNDEFSDRICDTLEIARGEL